MMFWLRQSDGGKAKLHIAKLLRFTGNEAGYVKSLFVMLRFEKSLKSGAGPALNSTPYTKKLNTIYPPKGR